MAKQSGFAGSLDTLPLHSVIYAISSNGRSGTLALKSGNEVVMLNLSAGAVTSVSSNDQSLRIGRLLVDQGYVTDEQVEQALALQSVADNPERLGEVMTELGLVSREQIRRTIAAQLEAALFRVLIGEGGTFQFTEKDPPPEPHHHTSLYLEPIVLNAMYLADEWLAQNEPTDVSTLPDNLIDPEVLRDVPEPERAELDALLLEYEELHQQAWNAGTRAADVKNLVESVFERAMVRLAFMHEEDEATTGRTGSRRQAVRLSDEFIDPWILIHLSGDAATVLLGVLNGHKNMLELAKAVSLPASAFNQAVEELVEQQLIAIRTADGGPGGHDEFRGIPDQQLELADGVIELKDLSALSELGRQILIELLNGRDRLHALIENTGTSADEVVKSLDVLVRHRLVHASSPGGESAKATAR